MNYNFIFKNYFSKKYFQKNFAIPPEKKIFARAWGNGGGEHFIYKRLIFEDEGQ